MVVAGAGTLLNQGYAYFGKDDEGPHPAGTAFETDKLIGVGVPKGPRARISTAGCGDADHLHERLSFVGYCDDRGELE